MEFYQKNPSALASLRGNVYEEKIINVIKSKAKPNKKEITKEQAEKILKEANKHDHHDHNHNHDHDHDHDTDKNTITSTTKKSISTKKAKTLAPKSKKAKKVSKK
jgi:trigger factor